MQSGLRHIFAMQNLDLCNYQACSDGENYQLITRFDTDYAGQYAFCLRKV